jgi:hypothetical protein
MISLVCGIHGTRLPVSMTVHPGTLTGTFAACAWASEGDGVDAHATIRQSNTDRRAATLASSMMISRVPSESQAHAQRHELGRAATRPEAHVTGVDEE